MFRKNHFIVDRIEGEIGFKLRQGGDIYEMELSLCQRKKDYGGRGRKIL